MDKQPLNTGEQKDMTEFFTDLITKMEEMSQELVKELSESRQETSRLVAVAGPVSQPAGSRASVGLLQKNTVKTLFGGVITNNVVSLVSRTFSLLMTSSPTAAHVCCSAGLRPRQSDRRGVLHRQMPGGRHEEHLRECVPRLLPHHALWR